MTPVVWLASRDLAQVRPREALPLYDPPCGLCDLFAALLVIYHPWHP